MALSDAVAVTMPDREDEGEVADDGTVPQPKTPDDGTVPQPVAQPKFPDDMRKEWKKSTT